MGPDRRPRDESGSRPVSLLGSDARQAHRRHWRRTHPMPSHTIGTPEEWRVARLDLLRAEKDLTRRGDELGRQRQALPWVPVGKDYLLTEQTGNRGRLYNGGEGDGAPGCAPGLSASLSPYFGVIPFTVDFRRRSSENTGSTPIWARCRCVTCSGDARSCLCTTSCSDRTGRRGARCARRSPTASTGSASTSSTTMWRSPPCHARHREPDDLRAAHGLDLSVGVVVPQ